MNKINIDQIKQFFQDAGVVLKDTLIEKIYEEIEIMKEEAYDEATERGINKAIYALYDANVADDEIIRVVNLHWNLNNNDIIDRIAFIKKTDAIECLKKYLKLQGYSDSDIREFIIKNSAAMKIRHEKDLWKLKKNPEKLMNAVLENKN